MFRPLKISAFYMLFVLFVDLLFTSKNNGKMLTIKAEFKKDGQKVDGTYNVKLRFEERKEQDIDLSLSCVNGLKTRLSRASRIMLRD